MLIVSFNYTRKFWYTGTIMSDSPHTPTKINSKFVHLHVHSHYSLLNALPTPKELAHAAKEDGQEALAITDAGALYGAIDFYKACTNEDILDVE